MGTETKVIRACEYCAYTSSRNDGYAACPKGTPTCSVFNGYYKFKPAVEERDPEVKMCIDCTNDSYCKKHPHVAAGCRSRGKDCWSPINVTAQEKTERMLNEMCDKVDTLEDVSKQAHYTRFKIQPLEFCKANDLGYLEGNVIKYVCRYPYKGAPLKDLLKARDYLDHLIAKQKEKTCE